MRHEHFASDEARGSHFDWQLFRRFLTLVAPYWRQALLALLLLPVVAGCKLVQPYLIKVAIDRYILSGDSAGLAWVGGWFLAALAAEALTQFAQGYLVQAVGQRIMADLRLAGMKGLQRLPAAYFDRNPSGRLVIRMTSDVENIGELFGAGVVSTLGDLLTLGGIVAAMLWLNLELSLVAFSVLPLLLGMVLLFRRHMRRAMRQVRARLADLSAFLAERIAGIDEVRLFGQEVRSEGEFAELQEGYRLSTFRVIRWDATLYAVVEALAAIAAAAILWWGGGQVIAAAATFGTLVAFIEYVQKFFAPLRDLSAKYSVIQASHASLERVFDLLDQPGEPSGPHAPPPQPATWRLDRVSFGYEPGQAVLQEIDLEIPPGSCVALVGATGSGKTTIGRLLLGLYRPDQGQIRIGDLDFAELDPQLVRRRIGWVSQEPLLFSGRVRDNLDPLGSQNDEQLWKLLAEVGADRAVRRLGGLDARLSERGGNLSAGERQLLCLVRALVPAPELLLLDEATSRLDAASEQLVQRGVRAVAGRCSQLLIAHRLRTVAHANRIILLHRGKVREQGRHGELMALNGLYARLWRLQELSLSDSPGEG